MIDRQYYPLAMAAKILECSEDDLIHFAATQKIEVHVLTGEHCIGNDTVDGSDILLPTITPVDYLYFVNLEAGHDYHLYLKVKPSIDSICYVVACSPFFNFCGDEVTLINNFVILHSELMKLKKPVEQATKLTKVIIHSELMKLKMPVEQNAISDVKGTYVCDAQDSYMSKELLILNEASQKFWGNADPKEKDTHLKRDVVIKHLIDKGFSEIKAKTGASIIRPVWAANGRRSTD